MKICRSFLLLLLLLVLALVPAIFLHRVSANANKTSQNPAATILKLPGPAEQDLMLGTWSIKSKYPPTQKLPNGDTGKEPKSGAPARATTR